MNKKLIYFSTPLLLFSLIFYALTLIELIWFDEILIFQIKNALKLDQPDKQTYKGWSNPPTTIYMKFYLFNITNPEAFAKNDSKVYLQQLGPYIFRETREKVNISINNLNGTISYREQKFWYFEPKLSNGTLEDQIIHLNLPLVSFYAYVYNGDGEQTMYNLLKEIIDQNNVQLFLKHTINELLFQGYNDEILDTVSSIKLDAPDSFALFYKENGSLSETFSIYNGALGNLENYGLLAEFNHKKQLNYWKTQKCNSLHESTTGDLNPPFLNSAPQKINVFINNLCRSLPLVLTKNVTYGEINVNHYSLDENVFEYENHPENRCYCLKEKCPANGIFENDVCTSNSSSSISFPHFLHANQSYFQKFEGLNPDLSLHEFYLDIDKQLGIVVKASAKLQINFLLKKMPQLEFESFVDKDVVVPIFWFTTEATLPEHVFYFLDFFQHVLPKIKVWASITCFVVGTFLLLLSLFCSLQVQSTKSNQDSINRKSYKKIGSIIVSLR